MLYTILAYHVEDTVQSLTPDEDVALMDGLMQVHNRLTANGQLGPAARLGVTADAVTLRGEGAGIIIDGPFAETREHLLGLYVVEAATRDEAVAIARDLRQANPSAVYEIRPILLYLPGADLPAG